jgi:hypothetical protein
MLRKIAGGQFDDLLFFSGGDGVRRTPEMLASSGFDFNEDQNALVVSDQIQFSTGYAKVSLKNTIPFFSKHLFSHVLG